MLPLDDSQWAELRHAYGSAREIPALLSALSSSPAARNNYEDEPWFSLWSSLCHQGDIYTASYAAVPHIVRIAKLADGPIDFSFFLLPTSVEIARGKDRGPEIPEFLARDYFQAIAELTDVISRQSSYAWEQPMLLSAAAAQAAAKGHLQVAEALLNLDDDWIVRINNENRD